jgi:hypothetical protein
MSFLDVVERAWLTVLLLIITSRDKVASALSVESNSSVKQTNVSVDDI